MKPSPSFAFLGLLATAAALAAQTTPAPTPTPTAAPQPGAQVNPPAAEIAPPDAQILPLLKSFRSLVDSLQVTGLRDEHMPALRRFRERVEQALESRPNDANLLAMDAQLSMWLDEPERVDQAFRRLLEASGGDKAYGQSWLSYFRARPDEQERLDRIREELIRLNPGDVTLVLDWATQLEQQARFQRALELLDRAAADPVEHPRALVTKAKCLMGEHRFDDAIAALDQIPAETLANNAVLRTEVDYLKANCGDYLELWAAEQEKRSTEAAADDLPRAEIVTSRGRIVVELFEDSAPNTVANFIGLAESSFYDGLKVHGAAPGQRLEVGDPMSKESDVGLGRGNPGWVIADELDPEQRRSHFTGSLSMVKGPASTDRAGSIVALSLRPDPMRNGINTVFGRVIEGMDAVLDLRRGDVIESVKVLRKREHDYTVVKEPLDSAAMPGLFAPGATAPTPVPVAPTPSEPVPADPVPAEPGADGESDGGG